MKKAKVAILTEHKSVNYGSVLQTHALYNVLSKRNDVYILNYRALKYHLKEFKDFFLKPDLKKIQNSVSLYKKIRGFVSPLKHQPKKLLHSKKKIYNFYFDKIVVGSDEMWNYNNPYRGKDFSFFGENWNCEQKISYATSFGATTDITEFKERIQKNLKKFSSISIRDFHSKKILDKIGISSEVVLDPTFMWDFNEKKIDFLKNYVFVYGYFDKKTATHIAEYCKENNLKTFTPQASNKWCDEIMAISPTEWVDYLYSCKYVFTSSFHGTILSIKYRKKFIYFKDYWSFNKVYNILEYLGLKENFFLDKNSFGVLKNENNFKEEFILKINSLFENSKNFIEKI
tara:strand:+ start:516 stop:1544 length:1029 start_codon:yes stop_codon:yes gene_type:complete